MAGTADVAAGRGGGLTAPAELVAGGLARRRSAYESWFGAHAGALARCCHAMAERFARDGRLLAIGLSPVARSDVRHVAVEFVHPVIVGKRALPALGLVGDSAPLAAEVAFTAGPDDIVMAFGGETELAHAIAAARDAGALTVAFTPLGAETELLVQDADPFIAQELTETVYHVLWELVHVFFEHRGLLEGRSQRRSHDAGAASFLYPFLSETEHDLDAVLADVADSAAMKAREVCELREATLATGETGAAGRAALAAAAGELRRALSGGGRLLALGNGGSATDATDVVADFASAPAGSGRRAWPALDLTADSAILTAIANDIGVEAIFARQIIAYGRAGDVLLVLTTSGNSASALDALVQARRQGLATIALAGYDGGQVASRGLADHVIVSPSQHIPRIQEAQATVYHLLRELVD
jgi:D-sedoheptulose 7-phosphate isomerase